MRRIALIGGTGLGQLPPEWQVDRITVSTPYGDAALVDARQGDTRILLLPRHGEQHSVPPHRINYHANIAALVELGVDRVFATNAVGSLRADLAPGTLVVLDDFIDMTRARPVSFLDRPSRTDAPVRHADMSVPYCPAMREALIEAANEQRVAVTPTGTYVSVDGPRYESPAEVRLFGSWGGDVVGMTGLPEAAFAREAGLCYAAIAIVTNFGAGLSSEPLRHGLVADRMKLLAASVRSLVVEAARRLPAERTCACAAD